MIYLVKKDIQQIWYFIVSKRIRIMLNDFSAQVDIRDKCELMGQIEEDIGIYDMQKDNTMWKYTV